MSKLPSNWQVKSLGEVAEIVTGGTPSTAIKEYWEGGNIPWLNSGELNQGMITSSSNYITRLGLKNSVAKLMPPDTILIALTGATTGRVGYLTFEACANQSVTGILPSANHYPKFLYYYLQTLRENILKIAWGGAQKHINQKFVKDLKIPLPPLPIQKQIAEILEKADQAKQKRKEANKLTDEFLQSVFIEMFGDPVKNPKGWRKDELKSIAIIERDSVTSENLGKADLYIGLEHIEKESGKLLGFEYVNEIDLKSNKFKFTSEHVLYGKLRPYLNKVCLPNFNGVCSTDIIPIKPRQNISDKYFLAFLMRMDFFVKEATIKSAGANLPRISPNILEKFKVYVPPLSLQQEFAEIVNKTEALKEKQKQSEQELENLFQSLMQKAFKGELVGTQPPAPSLTKRRGV